MEKVQQELILQLLENGCITKEEVMILTIPQKITIVADIKNWLASVDEIASYDDK